jgi:hypothetical protein
MVTSTPHEIVKAALAKGELDRLLLGAPEYQYRSKYSPAPGNTDLTELLGVIYDGLDGEERRKATDALVKALEEIGGTYAGIDALATCILVESVRRSSGRPPLGLPLGDLAARLEATIRVFEPRLRADLSGGGQGWPDGVLGDLRRISRNTEKYGGPPFCK